MATDHFLPGLDLPADWILHFGEDTFPLAHPAPTHPAPAHPAPAHPATKVKPLPKKPNEELGRICRIALLFQDDDPTKEVAEVSIDLACAECNDEKPFLTTIINEFQATYKGEKKGDDGHNPEPKLYIQNNGVLACDGSPFRLSHICIMSPPPKPGMPTLDADGKRLSVWSEEDDIAVYDSPLFLCEGFNRETGRHQFPKFGHLFENSVLKYKCDHGLKIPLNSTKPAAKKIKSDEREVFPDNVSHFTFLSFARNPDDGRIKTNNALFKNVITACNAQAAGFLDSREDRSTQKKVTLFLENTGRLVPARYNTSTAIADCNMIYYTNEAYYASLTEDQKEDQFMHPVNERFLPDQKEVVFINIFVQKRPTSQNAYLVKMTNVPLHLPAAKMRCFHQFFASSREVDTVNDTLLPNRQPDDPPLFCVFSPAPHYGYDANQSKFEIYIPLIHPIAPIHEETVRTLIKFQRIYIPITPIKHLLPKAIHRDGTNPKSYHTFHQMQRVIQPIHANTDKGTPNLNRDECKVSTEIRSIATLFPPNPMALNTTLSSLDHMELDTTPEFQRFLAQHNAIDPTDLNLSQLEGAAAALTPLTSTNIVIDPGLSQPEGAAAALTPLTSTNIVIDTFPIAHNLEDQDNPFWTTLI